MSSTTSQIESLLFAAGHPLSYNQIAKILKIDEKEAEQAIQEMQKEYQQGKKGIRIINNNYQAEMVSAPENAEILSQFLDYEKSAISQAKIEALTVLAYRGPLTQAELEEIRGVNCSVILRNLKIDDLIDEIKQGDVVKYQVTVKFLKLLGLESLAELPNYEKFNLKIQNNSVGF